MIRKKTYYQLKSLMPELPEVQTVVNHIKDELIGETIVDLNAIWPKVFHNFESVDFLKKL